MQKIRLGLRLVALSKIDGRLLGNLLPLRSPLNGLAVCLVRGGRFFFHMTLHWGENREGVRKYEEEVARKNYLFLVVGS